MRVAFRVDATPWIGTGHLMRCLTLARRVKRQGGEALFLPRLRPRTPIRLLEASGMSVHPLPALPTDSPPRTSPGEKSGHRSWLGCSLARDRRETRDALQAAGGADWLVVDHYALDAEWELPFRARGQKICVLDDLADRPHHCDVLVDQAHGRREEDYRELVSPETELLLGAHHAPLRQDFAARRPEASARPRGPVRRVLVSFGGSDPRNVTGWSLEVLERLAPEGLERVDVVLGASFAHEGELRRRFAHSPLPLVIERAVDDLAARMAEADLALGALGVTAWERCCLALPTAAVVLAANQLEASRQLEAAGAVTLLGEAPHLNAEAAADTLGALIRDPEAVAAMSRAAAALCDGRGAERICARLLG